MHGTVGVSGPGRGDFTGPCNTVWGRVRGFLTREVPLTVGVGVSGLLVTGKGRAHCRGGRVRATGHREGESPLQGWACQGYWSQGRGEPTAGVGVSGESPLQGWACQDYRSWLVCGCVSVKCVRICMAENAYFSVALCKLVVIVATQYQPNHRLPNISTLIHYRFSRPSFEYQQQRL